MVAFVREEDRRLNAAITANVPRPQPNNKLAMLPPSLLLVESFDNSEAPPLAT